MSLAGLYYYFDSKEKMLYLIQKHTFRTIVERLRERLKASTDPEERIRIFILNHLEYFLANQQAMKVLSTKTRFSRIIMVRGGHALKREYYRICIDLLDDLKNDRRLQFSSRTAVLSLFGMMNWIYTRYKPRADGGASARRTRWPPLLLRGVTGGATHHDR